MKSVPEGFDITKLETAKNKIIGPEIPKHLMIDVDDDVSNSSDTNVDFFGPSPSLMSSETPSSSYKFIGQKKTNEVRNNWICIGTLSRVFFFYY